MSDYRDEVSDEVVQRECRRLWQAYETNGDPLSFEEPSRNESPHDVARALIELGVRLGLEAAKGARCKWCAAGNVAIPMAPGVELAPGEDESLYGHVIHRVPGRDMQLCRAAGIEALDPAAVLKAKP